MKKIWGLLLFDGEKEEVSLFLGWKKRGSLYLFWALVFFFFLGGILRRIKFLRKKSGEIYN